MLRTTAGGRSFALVCLLTCASALSPWPNDASAQDARPTRLSRDRECEGDTISSITIRVHPPGSSAAPAMTTPEAVRRLVGLPYTSTREAAIRAYLRVAVGGVCTELDRTESERLLRERPFISTASIRATTSSAHHVRLDIDVVDEVPLVAGAQFRHGTVSSVLLGSNNVEGRGLSVVVDAERGFAYRPGFGVRAQQYAFLGKPAFLSLDARRNAVDGERFGIEIAAPFLTELQQSAFHSSAALESGYSRIIRAENDKAAIFVRRTSYDIGWVTRIGDADNGRGIGLLGAALIGEDVRIAENMVLVSDTGLVRNPSRPFAGTYPNFAITRIALITGLRGLRFITARNFDALTAEQDMGIGYQVGMLVGPGLLATGRARNLLVASEAYAGAGTDRSFLVVRGRAEARGDRVAKRWDGYTVIGRLAWYARPSALITTHSSIEWSAMHRSVYPAQLSFRDPDGGLLGYGGALVAGGGRLVARVQARRLVRPLGNRADVAVGAFAAAGTLWAGDVPYGENTGIKGSAGLTLLTAYPAGSKRTFRFDVALPFDPVTARTHAELRFSVSARAGSPWMEPRDVTRARTAAVPASLMKR